MMKFFNNYDQVNWCGSGKKAGGSMGAGGKSFQDIFNLIRSHTGNSSFLFFSFSFTSK